MNKLADLEWRSSQFTSEYESARYEERCGDPEKPSFRRPSPRPEQQEASVDDFLQNQ